MKSSYLTRLKAMSLNMVVAVGIAALQFVLLAIYFYISRDGIEAGVSDSVVGRDFVNLYTAGELLAEDKIDTLFSGRAYMDVIWAKFGTHYPVHNWSYPPTLFWPASFFALFDYFTALVIWHALGISLIALVVKVLKLDVIWIFLLVFSPAGAMNIVAGQNGFITAAFITFAMVYAARSPVASGISWAILTMKPHLGVVGLPMIIARQRWSVFLAGAVTFGVLVLASVAMWGISPWINFLTLTTSQQRFVLENWDGLMYNIVPSAFMQGRIWGFGTVGMYSTHAVVALIGIYLAIRAWPKKDYTLRDELTWFVTSTFLILPYSFLYDMVILQIVLALWHKDAERLFLISKRRADYLWVTCWMLPYVSWSLVDFISIQVTPIVLGFILWQQGTVRRDKAKAPA